MEPLVLYAFVLDRSTNQVCLRKRLLKHRSTSKQKQRNNLRQDTDLPDIQSTLFINVDVVMASI